MYVSSLISVKMNRNVFVIIIVCVIGIIAISGCQKKETYTVFFRSNNGGGTMSSQSFIEGKSQALNSNTFSRKCHSFTGWNTICDGSGISYNDGQVIKVFSDMTLYAMWKANTITVTFDANGGIGEMQPQAFTYGVKQALSANTFTYAGHEFVGWNTVPNGYNGAGENYRDSQELNYLSCDMTLYAQWILVSGQHGGHCYIDLGLPSGLLWATCNVGANSHASCGCKYAWGETSSKSQYESYNYTYTEYPSVLPSYADAASVNWGGGWRMPTVEEMQELIDNCTHGFTNSHFGIAGEYFTSHHNGNVLFLPASYKSAPTGCYWSSSICTGFPPPYNSAETLGFGGFLANTAPISRYKGYLVRPVRQP